MSIREKGNTMIFNNLPRYIYSDSMESMIPSKVYYKGKTYLWADDDMVYYWEESDEMWLSYDFAMSSEKVTW